MPSSALHRSPGADARLDRVFHALADRTRRALLARLSGGPAKVTELAAPFAMSLPAVSKHLQVLESAKLIERAVDGRVHRCSLAPEPLREAERWLDYYRGFWHERLDALARYVEDKPPAPRKRKAKR
jgi:DNA-binding transcriptional ArsR family regulator